MIVTRVNHPSFVYRLKSGHASILIALTHLGNSTTICFSESVEILFIFQISTALKSLFKTYFILLFIVPYVKQKLCVIKNNNFVFFTWIGSLELVPTGLIRYLFSIFPDYNCQFTELWAFISYLWPAAEGLAFLPLPQAAQPALAAKHFLIASTSRTDLVKVDHISHFFGWRMQNLASDYC